MDGSDGFIKGDHSSPANQTSLHSDQVTNKMGSWKLTKTTCQISLLESVCMISVEIWAEGCLQTEERMQDVCLCEMTKDFQRM